MKRIFLPAFSLLEIALVLVIIGTIMSMGLPFLAHTFTAQRDYQTQQNQERVLTALASYALMHQDLPLPDSLAPIIRRQLKQNTPTYVRGTIPYKTLGIPESWAKDGYHNWMTYVAVVGLSGSQQNIDLGAQKFCRVIGRNEHRLAIRNAQEQPLFNEEDHKQDTNLTDFPIVALISHGPQGRGALGQAALPLGLERHNLIDKHDNIVIDAPLTQNPQSPFSHRVVWVTRNNLMAVYAKSPCLPHEAAQNNDARRIPPFQDGIPRYIDRVPLRAPPQGEGLQNLRRNGY